MPEQLPLTALLNHLLAGPVTSLLNAIGVHPKYPAAPITNSVAMQLLVTILLAMAFAIVRSRLSVDKPGGLQHVAESIHGFFSDLGHELIGHDYQAFVPFVTAIGLF